MEGGDGRTAPSVFDIGELVRRAVVRTVLVGCAEHEPLTDFVLMFQC